VDGVGEAGTNTLPFELPTAGLALIVDY